MPRGRQRDQLAKQRILDATFDLVGEREYGTVSINEIAEAAGVAKQTIYRWWPSRVAVELDALVEGSTRLAPFPETDDVRDDLVRHLEHVIDVFNSPTGRLMHELLTRAHDDSTIAEDFRTRFLAPRRQRSADRLRRGIEMGQIRDDVDLELLLDLIYGTLWSRLLLGHAALEPADARKIVDTLWGGIAAGDASRSDPQA